MELINQKTFETHKILLEETETDYFSFHLAAERAVCNLAPRPGLKRYLQYFF